MAAQVRDFQLVASSSSFALQVLIILFIARLTQYRDSTALYLDLKINPEYPSASLPLKPLGFCILR